MKDMTLDEMAETLSEIGFTVLMFDDPFAYEDEYEDMEPDHGDGCETWFEYSIYTDGAGECTSKNRPVAIHMATNDNLDYGYPTEYADWWLCYNSLEDALETAGKSRIGSYGNRVDVFLDGEKI